MTIDSWSNRETGALFQWFSSDTRLYGPARKVASNGSVDFAASQLEIWTKLLWENLRDLEFGWTMILDVGSLYRVDYHELVEALRHE